MFKKITSSEKKVTLRAIKDELNNEFGWLVKGGKRRIRTFLSDHSKLVYFLMVLIIIISIILRFTVLRHRKDQTVPEVTLKQVYDTVKHNSLDQFTIMNKLEEMVHLKARMDSVLSKSTLTRQDSIFIIKADEKLKNLKNEIEVKTN